MAGTVPKLIFPSPPGNEARIIGAIAESAAPRFAPIRITSPTSLAGSILVHAGVLLAIAFALRHPVRQSEPVIEFEVGVISEAANDSRAATAEPARGLGDLRGEPSHALPAATGEPDLRALTGPGRTPGTNSSAAPGSGQRDVIGAGPGHGSGGIAGGAGATRDAVGSGAAGSLWGVGGGQTPNAASFVYVLDRSGSMQDTFPLLESELRRAIGSLRDTQQFNVIWFSEGPAEAISPAMMPATTDNKLRTFDAVHRTSPAGRTQPGDALRQGLAMKPDVLYLLSDGDFGPQNDDVIKLVQDARAAGANTTIHTILLRYETVPESEQALRRIAELTGGTYKHVSESQLGG